jgi:hypothetical protein
MISAAGVLVMPDADIHDYNEIGQKNKPCREG